jgi:hypothetical protein
MKIEMAGRAIVSAASEPFFLGSEKHKAAIAQLPNHKRTPEFDLAGIRSRQVWSTRPDSVVAGRTDADMAKYHTLFTVCPVDDYFYKIKEWPAYQSRQFLRCIHAYEAYSKARDRDPLPPSLLSADLFYGFGQIVIRMRFQQKHEPARLEDMNSPKVVQALLEAFLWLAEHDLAYIDIRSPNVLVPCNGDDGQVYLVDYDDMIVTNGLGNVIRGWKNTGAASSASLRSTLEQFFDSLNDISRTPYCFRTSINYECRAFLDALESYSVPVDEGIAPAEWHSQMQGITAAVTAPTWTVAEPKEAAAALVPRKHPRSEEESEQDKEERTRRKRTGWSSRGPRAAAGYDFESDESV